MAIVKQLCQMLATLIVIGGCLFGSAGRLTWPNAWALLGLTGAASVAAQVILRRNPELAAERANAKAGKNWDKPIVFGVVLLGPVATWITAGLDVRHGWSRGMPVLFFVAGVAVAILAAALIAWAMQTNKFFSAIIRIQNDRGHTVATGGPYRFSRHPGYAGMAAFTLATPLILGSWWALVPASVTAALTVLRTTLEDRVLHRELGGYAAYARTVRYKLLPAIW